MITNTLVFMTINWTSSKTQKASVSIFRDDGAPFTAVQDLL